MGKCYGMKIHHTKVGFCMTAMIILSNRLSCTVVAVAEAGYTCSLSRVTASPV